MKVKLFIVAIICLLQSCSTTDFLDEQRVETISNDNNEVSYVIPLEDALKNVEKVLDCINGASVSRASSLKSVKNIQILSISNTISSRSSHVNADTAIYIVNYDDGFALLGADYRLDPIYASDGLRRGACRKRQGQDEQGRPRRQGPPVITATGPAGGTRP